MAWYDQDSWLTAAFSPNLTTIFITLIVALGLPIIVHAFLYRKAAAASQLPTFLLVGPSGGGKTAFTTLVRSTSVSCMLQWLSRTRKIWHGGEYL